MADGGSIILSAVERTNMNVFFTGGSQLSVIFDLFNLSARRNLTLNIIVRFLSLGVANHNHKLKIQTYLLCAVHTDKGIRQLI